MIQGNENEEKQKCDPSVNRIWERVCKISNIVMSVIYFLSSWLFSFFGIMFLSLGLPEQPFKAVCALLACFLLVLIPVFCILGIVFSVITRREKHYGVAFAVQFFPFAVLGLITVLLILLII